MFAGFLFHIILLPFREPPIATSGNEYCNITIIIYNPYPAFPGKFKGSKGITMISGTYPFERLSVLQDHFCRKIAAFHS